MCLFSLGGFSCYYVWLVYALLFIFSAIGIALAIFLNVRFVCSVSSFVDTKLCLFCHKGVLLLLLLLRSRHQRGLKQNWIAHVVQRAGKRSEYKIVRGKRAF